MTAPRTADNLWQEAQSMTARYARRIGAQDAADLASQAVVKTLAQPAAGHRPGAYLEVVGRNLLADRWRHEACARSAVDELRRHEPEQRDPERDILAAERRVLVRQAILEIPSELRRPLLLRFFFDLPYSALARRLGIGEVTARTRVHRSLARLRASLAPRLRALLMPFGCFKPAAVALVMVAHASLAPEAPAAAPPAAPAVAQPAASRARVARPELVPDGALPAPPRRSEPRPLRHARPAPLATPTSLPAVPTEPEPVVVPPQVLQPDLTWVMGMPVSPPVRIAMRRQPAPALAAPEDLSAELVKSVDDL